MLFRSKYAIEQSLGNLLTSGHISFEEYVKALPEDSAMPKSSLKEILKDREEKENVFNEIEKTANALDSAMEQVMTEQEMNNVEQTGVNPEQLDMISQGQVPVEQVKN